MLASGESWADAAAASPLAAPLGAPVLLVPPGGLQSPSARPSLVEFLKSSGVRRIVIVGDPDVLPNHEPSVLCGLGMRPRNVERVHGDDPVGAAIAIAERTGTPAQLGEVGRTVIISSDQSVADAVAIGPLAAAGPFPLLFTAPDALDPRVAAFLAEQEVAHVVQVGGAGAIAPAVQEAIETAGTSVTRLAGRDRSDTARLAANLFEQHTADNPACAGGPIRFGLVPAQHPEQALSAGPLLARDCASLRYTEPDQLPADLRNTFYLARNRSRPVSVALFGGEDAVSSHVLDVDVPPVRFAAFNVRWNADVGGLVGVLQVIGERGVVRSFPETEIILEADEWIPSDWQWRPGSFFRNWPRFSWSPDGERLAFWNLGASELYVLDLRDGELRRIAEVDAQDEYGFSLNWSPDGSQLAFSALVEDASTLSDPYLTVNGISEYTTELFVHDFASAETVRLTHNNFRDSAGLWSPDGTRLAFLQTPASSSWMSPVGLVAYRRLVVMDLATKKSHELHPYVVGASWSPDGKMLALSAVPDGRFNTRPRLLYLAAPDGSRTQQLPGPSCDGCRRYPSRFPPLFIEVDGWSPAGDQIAYSALFWYDRKGFTRQIASGEISEIFHDGDDELAASDRYEGVRFVGWKPNGRSLMYLKSTCQADNQAGELSVIEIAADGSESSELLDLMPLLGDSSPSLLSGVWIGSKSPEHRLRGPASWIARCGLERHRSRSIGDTDASARRSRIPHS